MAKSVWREQAEKLVDVYLNWALSTDRDAGWHGGSVIGRLVDFRGDLPSSSGFYGVDNMEKEMRYLANHHADLPKAKEAINRLPDSLKLAVFSDRHYRNRVKVAIDPFVPSKRVEFRWTDEAIAATLEITPANYRQRVCRGYQAIESAISQQAA
jgi:hypothetical protein